MSNYYSDMHNDPEKLLSLMSSKLRMSYRMIKKELEEIGLGELDISHGDILYQLYYTGDMNMNQLAHKINKDKSTITALVKKLMKLDLIKKEKSSNDRRLSTISLTEKGESFRNDFLSISRSVLDKMFGDFSRDEQYILIDLLDRLG